MVERTSSVWWHHRRIDHLEFGLRPIDGIPHPHYHIHAFAFNTTYDGVEQRWKAGQLGNIKRDPLFYEAAFHTSLAEKLLTNCYGIRENRTRF